MKPPNLRYQESDEFNPDLDKRFKPEHNCKNCKHILHNDENDSYICTKYNYEVISDYVEIYDSNYPICNSYTTIGKTIYRIVRFGKFTGFAFAGTMWLCKPSDLNDERLNRHYKQIDENTYYVDSTIQEFEMTEKQKEIIYADNASI